MPKNLKVKAAAKKARKLKGNASASRRANTKSTHSTHRPARSKRRKKVEARESIRVVKVQEFRRRAGELRYDPDRAEEFFRQLKMYGPSRRAAVQSKLGYRRLFLEAYRVIAGLADHLDTPEFKVALTRYGDPPKGGSRDPEFVVLRLIFDYEAEARTLDGDEQRRVRANALKAASRDAAAVRYLLSQGISPPAATSLFGELGEGLNAWASRAPARRKRKGVTSKPTASKAILPSGEIPSELEGLTVRQFPCMEAVDPTLDLVGVLQFDRCGGVRGFKSFGALSRFLTDRGAILLKKHLDELQSKQ
jgi:hypothetical protein